MRKLLKKIYRKTIRKPIIKLYRFGTLKIVYPLRYRIGAMKKLDSNKVVFIEVRAKQLSDDFELLYDRLKATGRYDIHTHFLHMSFVKKRIYIHNCLSMIKDIANAKYVFITDASDAIACLPMRKGTIVTQVWHACGAFKKFGLSTSELLFGDNRKTLQKYPYHGNYTHVTVSADEIVWAYEEAMNLKDKPGIVKPVGVSRTDVFFDNVYITKAREAVYKQIPQTKNHKIILYAPTFRGRVASAKAPNKLDLQAMYDKLGDEYVLLIKHHPFIKKRPEIPEELSRFAIDVTDTLTIEQLLCASDICISDYSSLVFEYSLFEKPMIFFAYDLDEYYDWRGFYYDYRDFVPGPIMTDTKQIIDYIADVDHQFEIDMVKRFKQKFMGACDGHATDRIIDLVFGKDK